MASGDVGKGMSFWANIKISGDLKGPQLEQIVAEIQAILHRPNVQGTIVTHARVSDTFADMVFQVNYHKPPASPAVKP